MTLRLAESSLRRCHRRQKVIIINEQQTDDPPFRAAPQSAPLKMLLLREGLKLICQTDALVE